MAKIRKVTHSADEDFALAIRTIRKQLERAINNKRVTVPLYDFTDFPANMPQDSDAGQIAIASDQTTKKAAGYDGDTWFLLGGSAGPWYYFGTPGADNANGDTDTYLAQNPAPYDTDGIPYINGFTNTFAGNVGPGRYRLEATGDIGIYGGIAGGADGDQISTLVGVPAPLGGWDYPFTNSNSDPLDGDFTMILKSDLTLWMGLSNII